VTKKFSLDYYQPVSVVYQLRASILDKIRRGEDVLPDIQGREETKRDVLRALLSGYHIYLVSEEGTGKTRLAKSLTKLLSPVPRIKGCPYNDDPKWPAHLLCPGCRANKDSEKEYELVPGEHRFSRIQGNDYTDEGKLLGLKDIHAIAQGKSPTDALVFAGTGVFRANRGILFVDELPAIRTKVQVLLHPILEEKKAILEEYNWEHPLDIIVVATGNPQGFSHVNEVPRPLLDRLELIYMPLPGKEIEMEIMLREKFDTKAYLEKEEEDYLPREISLGEIERKVVLPWWIMYLLNESISHSRKCGVLDRRTSLRGGYRALDHTYASAELENRKVGYLKDAFDGLKLALRSRIELKPDWIDFENPEETFKKTDQISEDLLWNAFENLASSILGEADTGILAQEVRSICSSELRDVTYTLQTYGELNRVIKSMKMKAREKVRVELVNEQEKRLFSDPDSADRETSEQYNYSALEVVINAALHSNLVTEDEIQGRVFIPKMVTW